jgi:hypothetical protein
LLFPFPEIFTEAVVAQAIACSILKNDRAVLLVGARGIDTFKFGFESFTQITSPKLERVFPCHGEHAWIGLYAAVASAYSESFRVEAAERFCRAYSGNAKIGNSTLVIGKIAVFGLQAIVISGTYYGTVSVFQVVHAFPVCITEIGYIVWIATLVLRVAGFAGVPACEFICFARLPGQYLDAGVVPAGKSCGTAIEVTVILRTDSLFRARVALRTANDLTVFFAFSLFKKGYTGSCGIAEEFHFDGHTVGIVDVTGRAHVSALLSGTGIPNGNALVILADKPFLAPHFFTK